MLLPIVGVFVLRGMGLSGTLPWLSNSEHTAMLVGMLVFMLYRWEHYTSGYSFASWPPRRHGTGGLEHHLPKQGSRPPGQSRRCYFFLVSR